MIGGSVGGSDDILSTCVRDGAHQTQSRPACRGPLGGAVTGGEDDQPGPAKFRPDRIDRIVS